MAGGREAMRYFFDYIDNGTKTADEEGIELLDDAAARAQASLWLSEVASEVIPHDGQRKIGVEVRNTAGVIILSVGFSLASDQTGGRAPNIQP